jgi:hypothetical protein
LILVSVVIGVGGGQALASVIRTNYFHGSMCQGPSSGLLTYSNLGARASVDTTFICPGPWSVDMSAGATAPLPLKAFSFRAYWTTGLSAPTCTFVLDSSTGGLTMIGSPYQTVDPAAPTKITASSGSPAAVGTLSLDVRRAYMLCTVPKNSGIDGYTLNTCVSGTGDCPTS